MIQINLLPWREQARKVHQKRFGILAGLVGVFAVVCVVFAHVRYIAMIHTQNKRNAYIQQALDNESAKLTTLNKQKQDVTAIDDQLHFLYNLRAASYFAVRVMNEILVANPESVTLQRVERIGKNVTIAGEAKSNLQVTLFMQSLEKSKYFTQPVLADISGKKEAAGESRQFEIKVSEQE